jgi:hypothetical protein
VCRTCLHQWQILFFLKEALLHWVKHNSEQNVFDPSSPFRSENTLIPFLWHQPHVSVVDWEISVDDVADDADFFITSSSMDAIFVTSADEVGESDSCWCSGREGGIEWLELLQVLELDSCSVSKDGWDMFCQALVYDVNTTTSETHLDSFLLEFDPFYEKG